MKKYAYLLILILPLSSQADTLIEVIQRTLETSPDVLVTSNTRLAIEQELKQTQAGYLPALELRGGYGQEDSDNPTTRSQSGDTNLTRRELGLTLSQLLFDGFNLKYEVAREQSRVNSAAQQVKNTSEDIAIRTADAYLEILRRQELIELNKDNVVVHQKIQEQITALVKGGVGRQADTQQSASRIALAKSQLIDAQGQLRNAEITYLRLTGSSPKDLVSPPRELIEPALPMTLPEVSERALNHHPSLKAANADLEAAQAEHQRSNANFWPRFNLELEASNNNNLDGIEGRNDDLSAMVRMRYNLYRGGADQALRQETAERVAVAKEVVRRTQRVLEEEVHKSWNSLITIRARLEYLKQHVEATGQVLESYKEQFKLGQRSLLDVLDSEHELFNARSALVTAQNLELLGMFRVLASMGQLLETLHIQPPVAAKVIE